VNKDHC